MLKFLRAVIFKRSNMKRVAFIICAVLSVALAAEEYDIENNLKTCKISDSDARNKCFAEAMEETIRKWAKGSPELGLSALEPFHIGSEEVEYDNGLMYGKVVMKNTNTYGVSRIKVLSVKSEASEGRHDFEANAIFPRIYIEGEYKAEGRFNDFKLGGKGMFNVSMEGIRTDIGLTGRVENDRWIVEHVTMLPEVENMKVYFDDLFNGNADINNVARGFINEYWPLFYKELLPASAARWDIELTELVNRIFSKLSYSKLFV